VTSDHSGTEKLAIAEGDIADRNAAAQQDAFINQKTCLDVNHM
jgi:proteasome lid subunit RPN8/RPN11